MKTQILLVVLNMMATLGTALPAHAELIRSKAMERAGFYVSPREIQILDDRPTIRDFREEPQPDILIELPEGPLGKGTPVSTGGAGGADGAGGVGSAGGSNKCQSFRRPTGESAGLPKSGFGREGNIPARSVGPACALPCGTSTNRMIGLKAQPMGALLVAVSKTGRHRAGYNAACDSSAPAASAPQSLVASYSGGYSTGPDSGAGRGDSLVRGRLLGR